MKRAVIEPRVTLRPSTISGVGVFALGRFQIGQELGRILFPHTDYHDVKAKQVGNLLRIHAVDNGDGTWTVPNNPHRMCIGWYLNHSDTPNVCCKTWRAKRTIDTDMELTVDYRVLEPHNKAIPYAGK